MIFFYNITTIKCDVANMYTIYTIVAKKRFRLVHLFNVTFFFYQIIYLHVRLLFIIFFKNIHC